MRILLLVFFSLVNLLPQIGFAEDFAARTHTAADGATLPYRLFQPKAPAGKVPLVLFLHGAGERGSDNAIQLKHGARTFASVEAQEKFPCFIAVPQCPLEMTWSGIDWRLAEPRQAEVLPMPGRLAMEIVEGLLKEFPEIDPDRVYITGISMGGYGTWDLITRYPERFAAAIPICGGGDARLIARAKAIPVWTFHGDQDKAVKVEQTRQLVKALQEAGGTPRYTEYAGVPHDSWTRAYQEPELRPWLFSHRRTAPAP